ncbi:MAG: recombinase family protein [Alphaproteobacteria bacterium]
MLRCAIYTRKSTDEGLDQEFNSLDAQREACEAYIKSQKHEGWKLLPHYYDDGGYSGGSMERPALRKLLEEIEAGRVDIVVVYKVDRLTRALSDFARMVELFDKNKVSFVSVTQQFNTTTSMGRLTLNVLLSFAQFEREVTAERIRDKIAASKMKGMWMGSPPPLGYDVRDKKLVINETEARAVRVLFDLYLELGSVRALKEEADRRGIRTKHRPNTKTEGNKPFSRGNLYAMLSNSLYIGEVRHKKATYPGQHAAIIDRATWERVQNSLKTSASNRRSDTNTTGPHLLTGRIFDENGEPLCPTHTNKKGKHYHYYISKHLMHGSAKSQDSGWRLPARKIEDVVTDALADLLRNRRQLNAHLSVLDPSPTLLRTVGVESDKLASSLQSADLNARQVVLANLIRRVVVQQTALVIELDRDRLMEALLASQAPSSEAPVIISVPFRLGRRGVEVKLVLESDRNVSNFCDEALINLVSRSRHWFDEIARGEIDSVLAIAEREGIDPSDVGRDLQLAFLAPDIVDAILAGDQPVELTANRLRLIGALPREWNRQRELLGFAGRSGRT